MPQALICLKKNKKREEASLVSDNTKVPVTTKHLNSKCNVGAQSPIFVP